MLKKSAKALLLGILALSLLTSCTNGKDESKEVIMSGWGGDPAVNSWIQNDLAEYVLEEYNVVLTWSPMNIDEILLKLTNEKEAKADGSIDIVWINGENFFFADQNGLLSQPFLKDLPNAQKYLDLDSNDMMLDFGYPTEGKESPWGRAQFVFIHDSDVSEAFSTAEELKTFVMENPGKFTYPESSDFVSSAFLRTLAYDIVGYDNLKDVPADKEAVRKAVMPVMDYLNEIKPYLWKEGESYPKSSSQLETLYQDREVYVTMDYNSAKAYHQVKDGIWPESSRTFVWEKGTPYNIHFLAVAFNSTNEENALKVIDATLSPAMQASKADLKGWGDSPVIDYTKLSESEARLLEEAMAADILSETVLLSDDELSNHKTPELRAEVVIMIEEIWKEEVLLENQ